MERVPGNDELLGDGSDVISNKIYTANVRTKFDLCSESLVKLPQYRPPKGGFPGAVLRLACGTCLLFKSGKVVINGVKTEPDELEFEMVTDIRLYDVKLSHCSGYMKVGKLNLANLKIDGSIFEPELHPGLMFKIGKVSVIVHHTGVIMFCGCRSVEHAYNVKCSILKLINM